MNPCSCTSMSGGNVWAFLYPCSPKGEGGILFYLCPSLQDIFRRIFLSNCWWQKSDIWSQASYRYPISWEVFLDPSDSYFLFAEERGYHKWALAHRSSSYECKFLTIEKKKRKKSPNYEISIINMCDKNLIYHDV